MKLDVIEGTNDNKLGQVNDFESLIKPISKTTFFKDYWEQKPLLIKRKKRGYYDSLLKLINIEEVISSRVIRNTDMRIVKEGNVLDFSEFSDKSDNADRNQVLKLYKAGHTVIFEHLNRYYPELGRLLYQLESELHIGFRSNVYLTPGQSKGFSKHWDTHDVLILQVHGNKTWQIYTNPVELPLECQKNDHAIREEAGLISDVLLEEGDLLYMPRGYVHSASSNDETSLHITIGMRNHILLNVFESALSSMAKNNVELRKLFMLKEGFDEQKIKNLLIDEIKKHDFQKDYEAIYLSYARSRVPYLENRFFPDVESEDLESETPLKLNDYTIFKWFTNEDSLRLALDGKTMLMPAGVEHALTHIKEFKQFKPDELPGLDEASRLLLAKRLYSEGFVCLDQATG